MFRALDFLMDRLGERTTWAAIFGLLSAVGIAHGVAENDDLITSICTIASILSTLVGILTKEHKPDA